MGRHTALYALHPLLSAARSRANVSICLVPGTRSFRHPPHLSVLLLARPNPPAPNPAGLSYIYQQLLGSDMVKSEENLLG
ncbi:unnamed protein product [Lota lota]